ncbi:hypothetical protein OGAPHI_003400 [Ogataea philodendri]|uniref:Uncharacterized protein n=1 Tax=Ogataea philodendri TaxID=1378263 RepID=A0A9P8T6C4_9ASCO|nr:uncharacterized protein OGAPHI_003400 [Ogataea philodendri]KAH3666950.1 hypothetical protein OGAPHI_003400 [Ogataea philodendri]
MSLEFKFEDLLDPIRSDEDEMIAVFAVVEEELEFWTLSRCILSSNSLVFSVMEENFSRKLDDPRPVLLKLETLTPLREADPNRLFANRDFC